MTTNNTGDGDGTDLRPPETATEQRRNSKSPSPTLRRLHNFSFPSLSWGNHRLLRCSNALAGNLAGDHDSFRLNPFCSDRLRRLPFPASPSPSPEKPFALAPRSPVIGTTRVRVSKRAEDAELDSSSIDALAVRPWNLRSRRAACSEPTENEQSMRVLGAVELPMSVERRNLGTKAVEGQGRGENLRFSMGLSKEEIEQDFYAFRGTKPPRRPKKRPRVVQRQIDVMFPGFWLSELTPDSYKNEE